MIYSITNTVLSILYWYYSTSRVFILLRKETIMEVGMHGPIQNDTAIKIRHNSIYSLEQEYLQMDFKRYYYQIKDHHYYFSTFSIHITRLYYYLLFD